ncbi:hypothetical protein PCASD_10951 [Puccinia coronata f. sp. avenae]|uniref:Uncharacterized protein n=1 Tax=Puccinia coronata f. sp. avenae TaxID=200324 RepID=A0A2N5TD23_9BASI|nr:hypothetical protein PCASD_10951 [Puccinia coronata f. sp. avenae]
MCVKLDHDPDLACKVPGGVHRGPAVASKARLSVAPVAPQNGGVQINATVLYVRVAPPWCVTQSSRVRPPSYTSESRPLGASSSHHKGALDGPLGDLWTRRWSHNPVGSTDMGPSMGG